MIQKRDRGNAPGQLQSTDSNRADTSPPPVLPWEAPGSGSILPAFVQTCHQLLLHPRTFFERMARSGGLDEPLLLCSLVSGLIVFLAFPIALMHFLLTAPGAGTVSVSEYNRHLFPSRFTGFLVISLPVLLFLSNLILIGAGMLFHLAIRIFGGGKREESMSILIYAKTAGALPLLIAELVMLLAALACLGGSHVLPDLPLPLERVLNICIGGSAATGVLLSVVVFFLALISGTSTVWRLDVPRATAGSVAGMLLLCFVFLGPLVAWPLWGIVGAAIVLVLALLITVALLVTGQWLVSSAGPQD